MLPDAKREYLLRDLNKWWKSLSVEKKYEVYNCDICHK